MSGKFDVSGYVDVATRLQKFYEKYPEGSIQSEILVHDDKRIVVKASAYRHPQDVHPAVGHAAEIVPGKTPYTRDSELMVCETSAWGRALAALGFEVRNGIASAEEVRAAEERRAPTPVSAPSRTDDDALTNVWKDDVVVMQDAPKPLTASAALQAALADACPRHGAAWAFKEGTTKDGRAYAFWACPTRDEEGFCKKRPTIEWVNAREAAR